MIQNGFEFTAGVFLFLGFIWLIHFLSSPVDEYDENSHSILGILAKLIIKYIIPFIVLFVIIFGLTNGSLVPALVFSGLIIKGFYRLLDQRRKKDNLKLQKGKKS